MSNYWFGRVKFSDSKNPHDWMEGAEFDLVRAGRMHGDEDFIGAAFFSFTAIEKALKAFLIYNNRVGRDTKIHNLNSLWRTCAKLDDDFRSETFEKGVDTGVYLETKYPSADKKTYEKYDDEAVMAFMRASAEICGVVSDKVGY